MSKDETTLSIAVPYTIKDVNPEGYFGEINENQSGLCKQFEFE